VESVRFPFTLQSGEKRGEYWRRLFPRRVFRSERDLGRSSIFSLSIRICLTSTNHKSFDFFRVPEYWADTGITFTAFQNIQSLLPQNRVIFIFSARYSEMDDRDWTQNSRSRPRGTRNLSKLTSRFLSGMENVFHFLQKKVQYFVSSKQTRTSLQEASGHPKRTNNHQRQITGSEIELLWGSAILTNLVLIPYFDHERWRLAGHQSRQSDSPIQVFFLYVRKVLYN